jgi:hypothetical protein
MYVVDIGEDADGFDTRKDAIEQARYLVKEGGVYRGSSEETADLAVVFLSAGSRKRHIFAIWRDADGAVHESRDPAEVSRKWRKMNGMAAL